MKKRKLGISLLAMFLVCIGICDSKASLVDGLIGWYQFSGNVNDSSGLGNNATVVGATLTADRFGSANSAYLFDGVNDYISLGTGLKRELPM